MERSLARPRWRLAAVGAGIALALWLTRRIWLTLMTQLLAGYVLMALALPLCRRLEKRLSPGTAALLSFAALTVTAAGILLMLIPPLVNQFRLLMASFPTLLTWLQEALSSGQALLERWGLNLAPVRDELFSAVSRQAGQAVSGLAGMAGQIVSSLGKVVLAPLIGFYLLRDRRKISSLLLFMLPVRWRAQAVRAGREMRRETAGFLRGQLLVSAIVAVLTSLGLMLVKTPGWLALGLLMGVMELIPYIGPFIAGVPAVLLALQGGLWQAAWTLAVILLVQQLEGNLLSPRLMSGATKLHPLLVLLAVSAGGMAGGTLGMLLALPVVVSLRGALRGLRR